VTHNSNLAVVADAEQIIHLLIDKKVASSDALTRPRSLAQTIYERSTGRPLSETWLLAVASNPPHTMKRTLLSSILPLAVSLCAFTASPIYAGSATWKSEPTSSDWNTASNGTPETVPNGSSDVATFGTSTVAIDLEIDASHNQAGLLYGRFGFRPFGPCTIGERIDKMMPPNHAPQRNQPSRSGCNPRVPRAGSLSLGR
jgi:hypothetical protein